MSSTETDEFKIIECKKCSVKNFARYFVENTEECPMCFDRDELLLPHVCRDLCHIIWDYAQELPKFDDYFGPDDDYHEAKLQYCNEDELFEQQYSCLGTHCYRPCCN